MACAWIRIVRLADVTDIPVFYVAQHQGRVQYFYFQETEHQKEGLHK